jgi:hypothetical protein
VLTTQHPLPAKVGTNFADKRGRSVGIVRLRTKATEISFFVSPEGVTSCRARRLVGCYVVDTLRNITFTP